MELDRNQLRKAKLSFIAKIVPKWWKRCRCGRKLGKSAETGAHHNRSTPNLAMAPKRGGDFFYRGIVGEFV